MSHKGLHKLLLIFGFLFPWISPLSAQNNRLMLLNEEWDSYSQTSNRHVNGWDFCKSGINDQSIVQRGNLHAFLSTGSSAGSGTTIATPWLDQIADTFSFYIYGSTLNGHTAQVEFGFIPDNATISDPSDICTCFIPYDTVNLSVSNQWQRTTRDMRPYYAIHGTTHRLAIRLINSYDQEIYLDEIRAWIPKGNTSTCPNITSVGRDFWVMFLYNHNIGGDFPQNRRLYFASTEAATVNVHNNLSGDDSFSLTGPDFSAIRSYGTNQLQVGTVFEGGYHVTSSADIWLYARNFMQNTLDATVVFPTEALGTRYIVQDYPSTDNHGGEVGFVATEDNTVLSMTVPCGIQGTSITAGTTLSVTLNQGQAYMLLAARGGSLSGMEVTSNGKPFAMFHGDWNIAVPQYVNARDHCYEQALPVDRWGTEFIFGSIPPQSSVNHVRITASENNTLITREGASNIGPLQQRQTWQGSMSYGEIWHLTATKPIQVILYMGSMDYTNVGDPSSVTIPPLTHAICDSRFNCDRTDSIKTETHYLSIVCHEDYDSGLTLDEQPIGTRGTVTPVGNYRYRTVQVPYTTANQGFHHLQNNLGPFVAYAYGYSPTERESYAFPLGFSFDRVIAGIHRDTVAYYDSICQRHAYSSNGFSIGADETQVATTLSRMDSTVVDDTVIHYRSLTLTVLPSPSVEIHQTLPPDGSLNFADTTITETGTYVFHLTTANGCDSTVTLHVHAHDGTCPNNTSAGRDFWVMFLYNHNIGGDFPQNRRLYFASTEAATVNVHNNLSGDDSFSLTGPDFSAIRSYGTNQLQVGTVFEGGYHVTSSADIWLYARNFMQNTLDATVVFPTEALGTRYIVQDYPSTDNHGGEVGFVATEDNTVLSMTVPCGIQGTSITAGTTLSVTLNQGQAYMLLAARGGSLSGMEVTSNGKPFAMFHGDWNIAVPQYVNARDHCYEQALPVDRWGTEFIFGSIPPQSSVNHVRITASENNTLITREGASNIGPLQQRQTWQGSMSYGEIWHLTATKPIQVILYMGSMDYTNVGDPSSVTIPPLTHAICDSRFNCDRTDSIKTETHYLSIVCHEDYDSGLTLDEQPIGTRGTVTPVGNYRYRTVQVPYTTANQGFHHLQNNLGPFVAYAYGYSPTERESYAFPLGFSFDRVIAGIHRDTVAYYDSICQRHAYSSNGFSIGADETQVATTLSRMDSTVVDDTVIHYRSLTLTVLPSPSVEIHQTLPPDGSLNFADTTITETGTYVFHLTTANGCDSTVTLHVHAHDGTCPNNTSAGRDFWVMFLYNHNYGTGFLTEEQRLYFLGDQTSSVTISNNNSGSTSATLSSPSFSATQLCGTNQQIVGTVYEGGYHITSSEDIWVYADDFIDCNQDVATILPTEALGTHYIVQSYPSTNDYGAEVGFLATQDGTTLSFTVPCDVLGTSITAGTPLTITLNSGQTYMLMASAGGSFSGMEVSSNGKPFALFVAGQNTAVPLDGIGRDYTYEQALPVNLWGTEFIVSSTIQQNYNRLLITASADGCIIMKDGTPLAGPLAAGQTWEGVMPTSTQWHLTASSPIQVILYFGSYQTVGNIGDPSAVTIPPLNHGICDARFISIGTPEIPSSNHYINIICHQDLDVGLQLDDSPLPTSEIVATLGDYRCHQVRLTPGEHRLHNNLGPFIAYAYGLGLWESYAYPLGFAVDTIPVEPQPQPLQHDTITYSDSICMGQPYLLPEEFFCDGITYTPPSGLIYVRPSETAEAGTLEHWSNWVEGDTLVHHIHLILNILPSFSEEVYVTLPPDDSIAFADTVIGDTGTYVFHLTATNGCDSTVTLHVHACVVTLCVEFTGRTFIDFDYPVVTLRDCSPDRHTTRWEFSDGYRSNGERVRRQFQYPLPDTVIATMTTCDNDGCCGDTTFGFAPKIRSVWFPNIFFPDQESNNRFGCYTSHQVVDFELEIYNRWGLLVWRTTDIATPWDGTHDGTPVTQGAYVYRWFLEDIYGDRKAGTGTVTLIR